VGVIGDRIQDQGKAIDEVFGLLASLRISWK